MAIANEDPEGSDLAEDVYLPACNACKDQGCGQCDVMCSECHFYDCVCPFANYPEPAQLPADI